MNTDNKFNNFTTAEIELKLWEYIDGTCEQDEKKIIDKLIEDNHLWQEKWIELNEVNLLLASTELEQPSLRFTRNVMDEISKLHIAPATKTYINKKIIWSIGLFFITVIGGLLIYLLSQANLFHGNNASSYVGDQLKAFNYDGFANSTFINVFMMINVILVLLLVDRYLTAKKNKPKETL